MAQRVSASPSLSPGRRFMVSPQLPFRQPIDGPLKFKTNGPQPLYPPILQRHTRSTNDLVRKPQLDVRRLQSPQSRGRTVEGAPPPSRTATPVGLKTRGISPAILSPKFVARDIRPNFSRARSPALSTEPKFGLQGVTSSLKAPVSSMETGPSPRQYRQPIESRITPLDTQPRKSQPWMNAQKPIQSGVNAHKPGTYSMAANTQPGEYDDQMDVLRSSLMTHIASVQKEIYRLRNERTKTHQHVQQFRPPREPAHLIGTPSTVSYETTPNAKVRDVIRSSTLDSRGKLGLSSTKVGINSFSATLRSNASFPRALSVGSNNRVGSARGLTNGLTAPQGGSARLDTSSRNEQYDHVVATSNPPAKVRTNSEIRTLLPRQGLGLDVSSPWSSRLHAPCLSTAYVQHAFRPIQTAAARIQRAWRLSKWRRNFVGYGEKLGWVGTLDWLQKHNQLYGTELAEPADIRGWEVARHGAPLDAEVDPWGAEKLQEHLHRMWFGEPPPETHRRAHSEARKTNAEQTMSRREKSAGTLGIGLAMPLWRRSPSLGTRRLSEVQLSQLSPTGKTLFSLQRSPKVDWTTKGFVAASKSARLLSTDTQPARISLTSSRNSGQF